ncbi:hypothetical protein BDZ89DRAFT_1115524 [Hymenopellis radicata]|nr:hypothetical protein BDZ89DRAFT_1115524 [Hymenopellis radicata]
MTEYEDNDEQDDDGQHTTTPSMSNTSASSEAEFSSSQPLLLIRLRALESACLLGGRHHSVLSSRGLGYRFGQLARGRALRRDNGVFTDLTAFFDDIRHDDAFTTTPTISPPRLHTGTSTTLRQHQHDHTTIHRTPPSRRPAIGHNYSPQMTTTSTTRGCRQNTSLQQAHDEDNRKHSRARQRLACKAHDVCFGTRCSECY